MVSSRKFDLIDIKWWEEEGGVKNQKISVHFLINEKTNKYPQENINATPVFDKITVVFLVFMNE